MVYAIDYDGTIADTNLVKSKWIRRRTGRRVPPWKCSRTACVPIIGLDAYEEMANYVYERESSLAAEPVPGALEAIGTLARWGEVHLVSARPRRRIEFAREWLLRHGVAESISRYHTSAEGTDKLTLCTRIGARWLIDDDVRHLRAAASQDGGAAPEIGLIWLQAGRADIPENLDGIRACPDWERILELLREETDD